MSIYATLWKLKFPVNGDDYPGCEWIAVIAQGVPAHIGSPTAESGYPCDDPFAAFLPPPVPTIKDDDAQSLRAVVFVKEGTPKGTARNGQEYVDPLLVLTGEAYAGMTFRALHERICAALRVDNPRLVATAFVPSGRVRIVFEDGTSKDVSE